MILGDPTATPGGPPQSRSRITLDDLFRRAAAQRPDALAVADPPNRAAFTDGATRQLTYAEADRMIAAIAGRLRDMGLPTDTVVGIQLPNLAENVLTILGVLRAGLIPAPLPLLWRRADTVTALSRAGAKAFVTCRRVDAFEHSHFATRVAAEVFSIRYVCGYGPDVADGVVPLDDAFAADPAPVPPLERRAAAAHVAAVTFEMREDGPVPVARRHLELLAGGLCVLLESRLETNATLLSAIAPASFAGLCLTLVPWLMSGGTLNLHHPFDADVFLRQWQDGRCGALVLPGAVAFRLAEASRFAPAAPATLLAAWHAPERLAASPDWRQRDLALVDVPIFGEAGLLAARRGDDGRPQPIRLGTVTAPREGAGAVAVADIALTEANTLAWRGAMVPQHSFPPGVERFEQPHFAVGPERAVDSGYPCRIDPDRNAVVVTGAPSGIVTVGGYRFPLRSLGGAIGRIEPDATLVALPDPLMGQRLVGAAADPAAMTAALAALGLNPLVVDAFAWRGEDSALKAVDAA